MFPGFGVLAQTASLSQHVLNFLLCMTSFLVIDSPLTMPAFWWTDDPFLTSSPGFSEAVDSSATGNFHHGGLTLWWLRFILMLNRPWQQNDVCRRCSVQAREPCSSFCISALLMILNAVDERIRCSTIHLFRLHMSVCLVTERVSASVSSYN